MSTLVKSKSSGFPSLRSMMEDFWGNGKFFDRPFFSGETLPAVNIRETKSHYELELAAPGFKKADFKIATEDGLLIISAETSNEENEEKENYTRKEFSRSSFARTFQLPENVAEEGVNAKYADGLLTVQLKKTWKNLTSKKEVAVN
jgi:HSP20 family protein